MGDAQLCARLVVATTSCCPKWCGLVVVSVVTMRQSVLGPRTPFVQRWGMLGSICSRLDQMVLVVSRSAVCVCACGSVLFWVGRTHSMAPAQSLPGFVCPRRHLGPGSGALGKNVSHSRVWTCPLERDGVPALDSCRRIAVVCMLDSVLQGCSVLPCGTTPTSQLIMPTQDCWGG